MLIVPSQMLEKYFQNVFLRCLVATNLYALSNILLAHANIIADWSLTARGKDEHWKSFQSSGCIMNLLWNCTTISQSLLNVNVCNK